MAANWTDFVASDVLTAAQLNGVVDNFKDIAVFNETQSSGTNGGTFTSGSYTNRTLNTTVVNNISGCSIASSIITLPAGTFAVLAFAPAYAVERNKTRLQNLTDGTTIAIGQSSLFTGIQGNASLQTIFTIASSKTVSLQHRCQTTSGTIGYGVPSSFGDNEIYSQIQIARIA